MKKLALLLAVFLTFTVCAQAQTKFVSPAFSYGASTVSYGAELGICYSDVWLSANYTYTPVSREDYVGINLYNKVTAEKKLSLWVVNSVQLNTRTAYIYYNPGASVVYDLTPSLSPQFTVNVPVVPKTVPICTFSLMYNFK